MSWLYSGPHPDWLSEEPGKRFAALAEAWQEVDVATRQLSPGMSEQQRRALFQIFHVGASEALTVFPTSRDNGHFAELMAERWRAFANYAVWPAVRLRPEAAFTPLAEVECEIAALVEHQHGYFEIGGRAALLCLRSGISREALDSEIRAVGQSAIRRRQH